MAAPRANAVSAFTSSLWMIDAAAAILSAPDAPFSVSRFAMSISSDSPRAAELLLANEQRTSAYTYTGPTEFPATSLMPLTVTLYCPRVGYGNSMTQFPSLAPLKHLMLYPLSCSGVTSVLLAVPAPPHRELIFLTLTVDAEQSIAS